VYESEAATNWEPWHRQAAGRIWPAVFDALESTDVYTKQCSLNVTSRPGGDGRYSGGRRGESAYKERVVDAAIAKRVLAVLATAGLYERSGDWLYEIGLPGKSGVSGGIVTVSPGKGGLGTFSPLLDSAGNSIKGSASPSSCRNDWGLISLPRSRRFEPVNHSMTDIQSSFSP